MRLMQTTADPLPNELSVLTDLYLTTNRRKIAGLPGSNGIRFSSGEIVSSRRESIRH